MTSPTPEAMKAAEAVANEISSVVFNSSATSLDRTAVIVSAIARAIDKAVERERDRCCSMDVCNAAGINASDFPHTVVEKYRSAIRSRKPQED